MKATNQVSAQKRVAIVGATGMVGGYAFVTRSRTPPSSARRLSGAGSLASRTPS